MTTTRDLQRALRIVGVASRLVPAPTDPLAIGGAAFLMLLVSAVACYIPARRAADADPAEALRVH